MVRYHSLAITGPVGPEGHVVAWADDGVVMGVEHDSRPMWGVQFHPESIATEFGDRIARNFFELAERHSASSTARLSQGPRRRADDSPQAAIDDPSAGVARVLDASGEDRLDRPRPHARGGGADRASLRTPLRRRRDLLLARLCRRADLARPVLIYGDERRAGRAPPLLRRRRGRDDDPHAGRRGGAPRLDLRAARRGDQGGPGGAADRRRPRPDGRLRRLPRLRAESRLRVPERPHLRPPRRGDDVRQPRRRRRPRPPTHPRLRPRPQRATHPG